jgi:hypothetical protein
MLRQGCLLLCMVLLLCECETGSAEAPPWYCSLGAPTFAVIRYLGEHWPGSAP